MSTSRIQLETALEEERDRNEALQKDLQAQMELCAYYQWRLNDSIEHRKGHVFCVISTYWRNTWDPKPQSDSGSSTGPTALQ